jgi:hypothetical protein
MTWPVAFKEWRQFSNSKSYPKSWKSQLIHTKDNKYMRWFQIWILLALTRGIFSFSQKRGIKSMENKPEVGFYHDTKNRIRPLWTDKSDDIVKTWVPFAQTYPILMCHACMGVRKMCRIHKRIAKGLHSGVCDCFPLKTLYFVKPCVKESVCLPGLYHVLIQVPQLTQPVVLPYQEGEQLEVSLMMNRLCYHNV